MHQQFLEDCSTENSPGCGGRYGSLKSTLNAFCRLRGLNAVELRIALIDYFTVLVLNCPLPEASQSVHQSANNKIADEMAGGRPRTHVLWPYENP